jgi:hypothetical protein
MVFFMPVVAVITELKHSGGGMLRYLVAVPSAFVLGSLLVSLDWKLGKAIWFRCQRYSSRTQTVAAIASVVLDLSCILVGAVSGFKLSMFIAARVR